MAQYFSLADASQALLMFILLAFLIPRSKVWQLILSPYPNISSLLLCT